MVVQKAINAQDILFKENFQKGSSRLRLSLKAKYMNSVKAVWLCQLK